jgi:hypothetical protein
MYQGGAFTMGMSSHVVGIRPADDDYKKKLAALEACEAAGVEPPIQIRKFFGSARPNRTGEEVILDKHECVQTYRDESREGFTVDLQLLPEGVRYVRFYNSY